MEPVVRVANPVPPLATPKVPAKVTAPVVIALGVNPVVPALNEVTAVDASVAHVLSPRKNVVPDGVPVAVIPPTGRLVAFVNIADVGVPKLGAINVGLVFKTTLPVPVEVTELVVPNNAYSAGYVQKTLTVPEKLTTKPLLLEDKITSLLSALRLPLYVPRPTSQSPEALVAL